jgi:hypothetical protein
MEILQMNNMVCKSSPPLQLAQRERERERFVKIISAFVTALNVLSTNVLSFQRNNEFESVVDTVSWF